ncbi:hypothetical protein ACOMHN_023051 [Nucella lapillus]
MANTVCSPSLAEAGWDGNVSVQAAVPMTRARSEWPGPIYIVWAPAVQGDGKKGGSCRHAGHPTSTHMTALSRCLHGIVRAPVRLDPPARNDYRELWTLGQGIGNNREFVDYRELWTLGQGIVDNREL